MEVNKSIDTCLTKLIDKNVNLVEIWMVVDTRSSFNCLPHNTKPNKVKSPVSQVLNIYIIQW